MVYYRFTNMERTVRTHCGWRGSVKTLTVLLLQPGSVSLPSEMFGFPLSHLLRPLWVLPIPDRSVHGDPAATPLALPERTAVRGAVLHRARWQWGCFLWRRSVACSSNKLVAIKADAVFS